MPRRIRILVASAAITLTCFLAASAAEATFPGTNGRIAFSQGDLVAPIGGEGGDLSIHSQIFTIGRGGGGLTQLTHVAADQSAGSPDWSPNGDRIVYESNESGSYQIWLMDANGTRQTQLTDDATFESFQPSFSPDGDQILFSRCGEPLGFIAFCDIAVINANGTGLQTLLRAGRWSNVRPVYSPDGRQIAFSTDRGGRQSAVWVMEADGSSLERLTPTKLRAFWPDWSPDGKRILFSDHCCVPHSNLWTVRPTGSGLTRLSHVAGRFDAAFASYSPDGKRIVTFFSRGCDDSGSCTHFYTLHADGTHFHRVVTGKGHTFLTDWGPGG
jgi:Tol biopolymer transport system component